MKKWSSKINLDRDLLSSMPIWIKLPELNLRLWDSEILSAIASVVGNPLKLDDHTAKETRLSFARILVEINADSDLPNETTISLHDGENLIQTIEYEWIPPRCKTCLCFGHSLENCDSKMVWKVKQSLQEKVSVNPSVFPEHVNEIANTATLIYNSENIPAQQENNPGQIVIFGDSTNVQETNSRKESQESSKEQSITSIKDDNSSKSSETTGKTTEISTVPQISNIEVSDLQKEVIKNQSAEETSVSETMILDDSYVLNNLLSKEPSENHISYLASHLSPISKNSVSDLSIQKAISLVSNSASPSKKGKKEVKEKRKSKMKSIKEIVDNESPAEIEDSEFKRKYIIKNSKWEDQLKTLNKTTYKKKEGR